MGAVARTVQRAYERKVHPLRLRAARRRLSQRSLPEFVLVVCHGNICRSPYAAALLRRRLPPHVRVGSAGFTEPGRACPDVAQEVAAARDVDLSLHRSQLLTPTGVFGADLILVMNTTQQWAVRALFGCNSRDVVLLGDLDPEAIEMREIRDPNEQPKEVFESSYSRIERCVGELVRSMPFNTTQVSTVSGLRD